MVFRAIVFVVLDAETIEKFRIFSGRLFAHIRHAARIVILAVGLQKTDRHCAGVMSRRRGSALAISERPYRLIGIGEFARHNLIADQHIGEFPPTPIGISLGLG